MKLTATRRVEHSIRILKYLATLESHRASAQMVADATGIASDSVSQLMQVLIRAQLVASVSGPNGGYWLSCVPSDTNLRTVVEACEGPIDPQFCSLRGVPCGHLPTCALHEMWVTLQSTLVRELSAMTLTHAIGPSIA